MPPSRSAALSTHSVEAAASLRSTVSPYTSWPASRSSAAVFSAAPSCRSQPMTRAPSAANSLCAASPWPPAVPVIRTRFPSKRIRLPPFPFPTPICLKPIMVILDAEGFGGIGAQMHLTKLCEARPERGEGWGTQPLTDLSWLIDAELGDSEHGAVARMTIEAGGDQEPHRHPGSEEVTLVLEGNGSALIDGAWVPIEEGNLLHAPAG